MRSAATLSLGVLASGNGTTLQAIIDASEQDRLHARPVLVISNQSRSGALRRADQHGLDRRHISSRTHPDPLERDEALRDALQESEVGLVVLAGYMKKIGPRTLAAFEGRIINTHPSLLPRYGGQGMYGRYVHQAVLEAGEDETGISIHLVDGGYDTGRVLAQARVPVLPEDDAERLAARVQRREREFLVETLDRIARGEAGLDL